MLLALSICFCYKLIGLISVPTKMNGWSSEQDREEREERGKIKCYWGFFFPHVGFNCDWRRYLKKIKCFIIIFIAKFQWLTTLARLAPPRASPPVPRAVASPAASSPSPPPPPPPPGSGSSPCSTSSSWRSSSPSSSCSYCVWCATAAAAGRGERSYNIFTKKK